jgi:hypothetical protein
MLPVMSALTTDAIAAERANAETQLTFFMNVAPYEL